MYHSSKPFDHYLNYVYPASLARYVQAYFKQMASSNRNRGKYGYIFIIFRARNLAPMA